MLSLATQDELAQEIQGLGSENLALVKSLCGTEPYNELSLLLAIGSRETWLQNIQGDDGHGKGGWQIDNRTWSSWLASVPGVVSGTWGPVVEGVSARDFGYCPTASDGLSKALSILIENWEAAVGAGIAQPEILAVAIAAYNAGPDSAISGCQLYGNPDLYTTGQNYSSDVLGRQAMIVGILAEMEPKPDPLAPLTPFERGIVEKYEADEKHPHLHHTALAKLRGLIVLARKAVWKAANKDGLTAAAWAKDNRAQRYRILSAIAPPHA